MRGGKHRKWSGGGGEGREYNYLASKEKDTAC